MEPVRTIKLSVYTEDMPESISGVITPESVDSDSYIIVLNKHETPDQQRNAFLHEMIHVWNCDFDRKENVQEIESRTHQQ